MDDIRGYYYALYQDENPEKFNEELIHYKSKEDILYFRDAIGNNLEIIMQQMVKQKCIHLFIMK